MKLHIIKVEHMCEHFRLKTATALVRCGEWDTQTTHEPQPHQDRKVVDIVNHPEFNSRNLANDLALLFLESDFELSENVDTVCLPQPNEEFDEDRCWVTGWGKDEFGKKKISII